MSIDDKNPSEALDPQAVRTLPGVSGEDGARTGGPSHPPRIRADRGEISETGRARAARGDGAGANHGLSPQRIDAVRLKVAARAFDSPELAAEVARRMLARGDP
jgi:hypothetical protein